MILQLKIGDEGPTDINLKDGDIFAVHPDTWVPGTQEAKKYLNIKTEDFGEDWDELVASEYGPGPEPPPVRHMRKYFVPYWLTFDPEELALIRDKLQTKPVYENRFTVWDITRK